MRKSKRRSAAVGRGSSAVPALPIVDPRAREPTPAVPALPKSERIEEREQRAALRVRERREAVARGLALAVMREDRGGHRSRSAVVQEPRLLRDAPQRLRAHLGAFGVALIDSVAERAHVVEKEIGEGMVGDAVEGGAGVRRGHERLHVTEGTTDRSERGGAGARRAARRWAEKSDEVVDLAEGAAVGIVHAGRGILRQQGAVSLRTILVGKERGGDSHFVEEGVRVELEQRRQRRLPAEPSDAQVRVSDL